MSTYSRFATVKIRKNLELVAWSSNMGDMFFTFVGPTGTVIKLTKEEARSIVDIIELSKSRRKK